MMQGERVGLEAELASLRAECDKLREGLAGLKEFSDQRLQQEVDSMKAELERKEVELSMSCDSHVTSCSATLDELECLRTANLLLQQEVRCVEVCVLVSGWVGGCGWQAPLCPPTHPMDSADSVPSSSSDVKLSLALANQDAAEKKRLLDEVRQQLEAEASIPDEEVDLGERGKTLQYMQEECLRLTREIDTLKVAQSDQVLMHQQLQDANKMADKLRHSLGVAKAGKAELEGSAQALKHVVAILTTEVKGLKEDKARLEEEADTQGKRVEGLLATNSSLQERTNQLADECSRLKTALQVAEGEGLSHQRGLQTCGGTSVEGMAVDPVLVTQLNQWEKERSASQSLVRSLEEELQKVGLERERTTQELVSNREEVALLRSALSSECASLKKLTRQQERHIASLLGESVRVAEGREMVENVCQAQDMAVREREESISRLTAEVGALRSRHAVLTSYLEEQELSTGVCARVCVCVCV